MWCRGVVGGRSWRTILQPMVLRRTARSNRRSAEPAERAADPDAAGATAVALLARRDLPSGELRERLGARGFAVEATAAGLAALAGEGAPNGQRCRQNL